MHHNDPLLSLVAGPGYTATRAGIGHDIGRAITECVAGDRAVGDIARNTAGSSGFGKI